MGIENVVNYNETFWLSFGLRVAAFILGYIALGLSASHVIKC